jgi:hypothetical protein
MLIVLLLAILLKWEFARTIRSRRVSLPKNFPKD